VADRKEKLSKLQQGILAALKNAPAGLDIDQLRSVVTFTGTQQHFDRRLRGLDPFYIIERSRQGRRTIYKLIGDRPAGEWDYGVISKDLRAKIYQRDGRRCKMCGKTVAEDHVKLHIDHKIPREWGGETVEENLEALCSGCNEGKKNYFASFDADVMSEILENKNVHHRIAALLKVKMGEWIDSDLLEFVANFEDYQDDWQRRLRELRACGLEIEQRNRKEERRVHSYYRIERWVELPKNVAAVAREQERKNRLAKNQSDKK